MQHWKQNDEVAVDKLSNSSDMWQLDLWICCSAPWMEFAFDEALKTTSIMCQSDYTILHSPFGPFSVVSRCLKPRRFVPPANNRTVGCLHKQIHDILHVYTKKPYGSSTIQSRSVCLGRDLNRTCESCIKRCKLLLKLWRLVPPANNRNCWLFVQTNSWYLYVYAKNLSKVPLSSQ
jgi:hypothetical protein